MLEAKVQVQFQKNFWIYVLVLIFVGIFSTSFIFREAIYGFINLLAGYLGESGYFGIFIFISISAAAAILSPLSSIPLTPSAIIVWGNELTLFFLLLGWMIGGVIGYTIGYFVEERIIGKYYSFQKVEYYKSKLSSQAQFWIVLVFRLAVPSEIAGYTLGVLKYHFGKYLIATFISEVPFALLAVYSSTALMGGRVFVFAGLIALCLVFISAMSYYHKKHIK